MKRNNLFLFLIVVTNIAFGQTDQIKSTYKNLVIKKFYVVDMDEETRNGKTIYKVNENVVNKKTYEKYNDAWKNMETCNPCILESYDIDEVLLHKAVQYTDCIVGQWIEYYPNGKIKTVGQYKENKTRNWGNLEKKGYCSKKDGVWTFYDEYGKVTHVVKYKDGKLVE